MKVDMSPTAIENRLKLVGELTRACLLIRRATSAQSNEKAGNKTTQENSFVRKTEKTFPETI